MKKIITLILLFVTLISFGQKNEYKHAKMLYKDKLYTEANAILDKILNNEYGILYKEVSLEKTPLEGLFEMHCWDLKKECLLKIKDYKAAYTSAEKHNALFREFVGSSDGFNELASDELKLIKTLMENVENQLVVSIVDSKSNNSISDKKDDIESKVAETTTTISDNKTTLEPSSATKTDNTETKVAETTKPISDYKTVILTVSGTGKTLEEAKLNALRSAIEQAFGAFISSKTEILNDKLVKDEIVSVASGNVQKFDIVSQIEIPNTGFGITINATVSIDKLTSFAESKGVVVEFKGGMFANNIKLQKLNESSEYKVIKQLYILMHEKFQTIFDYNIETKNPVLNADQINYNVPITVSAIANNNLNESIIHLIKNMKAISLNESEILDYKNLNKQVYKVNLSYNNENYSFYLRYYWSFQWFKQLANSWGFYLCNYNVENGISSIDGPGAIDFVTQEIKFKDLKTPPFVLGYGLSSYFRENDKFTGVKFSNGKISYKMITYFDNVYNSEIELNLRIPLVNSVVAKFEWDDLRTLSELEKISNYKVNPAGIVSVYKNGGYVIYEKDGHGIIVSPYFINTKNNWGSADKFIGTGEKLFDGKLNTEKISKISEDNVGIDCKKFKFSGYDDWVIPSSDEMILILNKLYLSGILQGSSNGEKLISSTEDKTNPYRFDNIFSFNVHSFQFECIKQNINNKDFSIKNILKKIEYDEMSTKGEGAKIQPIRYF